MQAFEQSLSDAARLTEGWTQAQVDAVNAAQAVTDSTNAFAASLKGLQSEGKSLQAQIARASGNNTLAETIENKVALAAALEGVTDEGEKNKIRNQVTQNALDTYTLKVLEQKNGLQDELNSLTDTNAQALQRQRDALEASNQGLFDQVQAIKAKKQAEKVASDFNRAMLDAAGNTTGLAAFDKAISDAARITEGWTQAQIDAVDALQTATIKASWQDQLDTLLDTTGATERRIALEKDLATTTDAGTQALIRHVHAQTNYNTALANLKTAQSAVDSIRSTGTAAYISAQERVADAQKSIADIQLQAQRDLQAEAQKTADDFKNLAESLREFAEGEVAKPTSTFAALLTKALAGDKDAMGGLADAATKQIEYSKENAATGTEARIAQARTAADVYRAAMVAQSLSISPDDPAIKDADPLIAANAELAAAQTALADALRVANAINAPLTKSIDDLITQYAEASATLVAALATEAEAKATLEAIKNNTAATTAAVTALDIALANLKIDVDATIDFITGSTLPDDLKDLALGGARQIKTTVDFLLGSTLPDALQTLATTTTSTLNHTINYLVGAALPDDIKAIALTSASTLTKYFDFVVRSALDNDTKTLALTTASTLTKTVDTVAGSALPDDIKTIALGQVGTYTTTVQAVLASTVSPTLKGLILDGVGGYAATVTATAAAAMPAALKAVIFDGVGNYTSTISAVMSSSLTEAQKTILLNSNSTASRAVTLSAYFGSSLTAEQSKALTMGSESVYKIIEQAVTGSALTAGQIAVLAQDTETVSKTINALINDSSLTAAQKSFLGAITGATSSTITLGGAVTFDPNATELSLFKGMASGILLINDQLEDMYNYGLGPLLSVMTQYTGKGSTFTVAPNTLTAAQAAQVIANAKTALGFASGGAFTNGMVTEPTLFSMAQMGEAGPEAIMPLTRTSSGDLGVQVQMPDFTQYGRGQDNADLVAEIKALREENQAQARAMVVMQQRMTKVLERWDGKGIPEERVTA